VSARSVARRFGLTDNREAKKRAQVSFGADQAREKIALLHSVIVKRGTGAIPIMDGPCALVYNRT